MTYLLSKFNVFPSLVSYILLRKKIFISIFIIPRQSDDTVHNGKHFITHKQLRLLEDSQNVADVCVTPTCMPFGLDIHRLILKFDKLQKNNFDMFITIFLSLFLPLWVISSMSSLRDFINTISGYQIITKPRPIICGSHKKKSCTGLEPTALQP